MKRATGEERALARATIYRLLALSFSYPTEGSVSALNQTVKSSHVAADLISFDVAMSVAGMAPVLAALDQPALESTYQLVFTLSYSEDCPINETAFSARHLFQQTAHQADIAGFYRAFGVDTAQDRSDLLAMELEFCYLLALKEAHARARREEEHVAICRQAHRSFLREHLARWAPLAGRRITVTGEGTFYERAARVLLAFIAAEARYLRLGPVDLYRDDPVLIADEPGDLTCPVLTGAVEELIEWPASGEGVDDGLSATIG